MYIWYTLSANKKVMIMNGINDNLKKNNWPSVYSFFVFYYQNDCIEIYSKICLIKDVKWKDEVIYLETPNIDYSAASPSASSASNPEKIRN